MRLLPLSTAILGAALLSGTGPARSARPEADCESLRQRYDAALEAAQVCQPDAPEACQAVRPRAPDDPCRCQASVNEAGTAELDALLARWRDQACPAAPGLCNRRCTTPAARCLPRPAGPARCG